MKAAIVHRYGPPDAVTIAEIATPVLRPGEVLVRVDAAAVTAGDARLRSGRFPRGFGPVAKLAVGITGPRAKVLGVALSGTVEAVAPDVTASAVGDEVAGMTGTRLGGHAQYAALKATALAAKPAGLSHTDAAGVLFGGSTAQHFLRKAGVTAGTSVLINGASGAVGSSAVQLAAQLGANVTGVTSAHNSSLVTRLGAQHVINYAATPLDDVTTKFDVVFDAVGNISRKAGLRLLTPGGTLILAVADLLDTVRSGGRVLAGAAPERAEDFAYLLGLAADGTLDPVTEVIGGLEALPAAYARIDSGRKVGNIVVTPQP